MMFLREIRSIAPPLFVLLLSLPFSLLAHANQATVRSIDPKTITVIYNTLKYIHGLAEHHTQKKAPPIIIIYDPAIPDSQAEANAFIEANSKAGTPLATTLVDFNDLESIEPEGMIFVPHGLGERYDAIHTLAKAKHLFPISTDQACVKAKCCILSFTVGSRISIFLNEKNLRNIDYSLDPAFRFMVRRAG